MSANATAPPPPGWFVVTTLPVEGGWNGTFSVDGIDWGDGFSPLAENRRVNPDYFDVMRIPIVRGRGLTLADGPESQGVVLVNQEFVRQVFGDECVGIGKREVVTRRVVSINLRRLFRACGDEQESEYGNQDLAVHGDLGRALRSRDSKPCELQCGCRCRLTGCAR